MTITREQVEAHLKALDWYETGEDWPGDVAVVELILKSATVVRALLAENERLKGAVQDMAEQAERWKETYEDLVSSMPIR